MKKKPTYGIGPVNIEMIRFLLWMKKLREINEEFFRDQRPWG